MEEIDKLKQLLQCARGQAGYFTEAQADCMGVHELKKFERTGQIVRRARGVYQVSAVHCPSFIERLGLLQCGFVDREGWPAIAFSHLTALHLHGYAAQPEVVQFRPLTKSLKCLIPGGLYSQEKRTLSPEESVHLDDGIKCTSLLSTLVDLLDHHLDHRVIVAEALTAAVSNQELSRADILQCPKHSAFMLSAIGERCDKVAASADHPESKELSVAIKLYAERMAAKRAANRRSL